MMQESRGGMWQEKRGACNEHQKGGKRKQQKWERESELNEGKTIVQFEGEAQRDPVS